MLMRTGRQDSRAQGRLAGWLQLQRAGMAEIIRDLMISFFW
jgi:hypothetical protein